MLGYPKLVAVCEEVLSPQKDEQLRVYYSDTWLEFHHLLLNTLNGYIRTLVKQSEVEKLMKDMRKKKMKKIGDKEKQRKVWERKAKEESRREVESRAVEEYEDQWLDITLDIFDFSHLLWWIEFLQVLWDHLGLLSLGANLQIPTLEQYNMGTYKIAVSGEERNHFLA